MINGEEFYAILKATLSDAEIKALDLDAKGAEHIPVKLSAVGEIAVRYAAILGMTSHVFTERHQMWGGLEPEKFINVENSLKRVGWLGRSRKIKKEAKKAVYNTRTLPDLPEQKPEPNYYRSQGQALQNEYVNRLSVDQIVGNASEALNRFSSETFVGGEKITICSCCGVRLKTKLSQMRGRGPLCAAGKCKGVGVRAGAGHQV